MAAAPPSPTRAIARTRWAEPRTAPTPPEAEPGPPPRPRTTSAERPSSGATRNATSGTSAAEGEGHQRRQRRLHRAGGRVLGEAELVAGVGRERVLLGELAGHLHRQLRLDATRLPDLRQLAQLGHRVLLQRLALDAQVGLLDVALARHRHVLAERHRQRAGRQARDPRGAHRAVARRPAPATPTMRHAVDTTPSLAPSTAARSQPARFDRWGSACGCATWWWVGAWSTIDHQPATGRFAAMRRLWPDPRPRERGGRRGRARSPSEDRTRARRSPVAAREHGRVARRRRHRRGAQRRPRRSRRQGAVRRAAPGRRRRAGGRRHRPSRGLRPAEGDRRGPSAPSRAAGSAEVPRLAVVSRRLDLDPAARLFSRPRQPPVRDHAHGRTCRPPRRARRRRRRRRLRRGRGRPRRRAGAPPLRGRRGGHLRGRADPERHPHRPRPHRRVGPHAVAACSSAATPAAAAEAWSPTRGASSSPASSKATASSSAAGCVRAARCLATSVRCTPWRRG